MPPYSRGVYFIEVVNAFRETKWSNRYIFGTMMEPVYTRMIKQSYLFLDESCAKVSNRRIDPSYRTFAENMAEKYPGYAINEDSLIVNKSDTMVNLD